MRWWDGVGWQEQTLPKPQQQSAPEPQRATSFADSRFSTGVITLPVEQETIVVEPAPARELDSAGLPSRRQVHGRLAETTASDETFDAASIASVAPELFVAAEEPSPVWRPARTATGGAWGLAFLPWISLMLGVLGAIAYLASGSLGVGSAVPPVIGCILLLLSVSLVMRDRRKLDEFGHQALPSAWWILLGPLVYLVARTVRVVGNSGHGIAPLIGLLVNTAGVAGVALVVLVMLPSLFGTI